MDQKIECHEHGQKGMAFVCHHLLAGHRVGWNEPEGDAEDEDDEFAGCINAWCDECENVVNEAGAWSDDATEAFADIRLICENCALQIKRLNSD